MKKKRGLYHFNLHIADGFDAYLLKETETTYEYIAPLAYIWMQNIALENWEEEMETLHIDKQLVTLEAHQQHMPYDHWLFDYPVKQSTLRHFQTIMLFFDTYYSFRTKSPLERLEKTIEKLEKRIPLFYLEELVTFVFSQHQTHPERLRFLFSAPISKYIKEAMP